MAQKKERERERDRKKLAGIFPYVFFLGVWLGVCIFYLCWVCKYQEDGLLYVEADPSGGDSWKLDPVVQLLKEGAVGVIPTDTLYVCFFNLATYASIIYLFNLFWVASVVRVVLSLNMVY